MTLPLLPSPPLAPLSPAQIAFLVLHTKHVVYSWQWHFMECQLRARANRHSATIWRDELEQLVQMGLMQWGLGVSVGVTALGREAVSNIERV